MKSCLLTMIFALTCSASALAQSSAPQRRVAVLEFELAPGVDHLDRTYLSDRARAALHDAAPQLFVMTRESTEALLQANGQTLADCIGECEVDVGRKLGADYIVSGRVTLFGTRISVTMRLFSTADGQLLSSSEARGDTQDKLQDALDAALPKLFSPLALSPPILPAVPSAATASPEPPPTRTRVYAWIAAGTGLALFVGGFACLGVSQSASTELTEGSHTGADAATLTSREQNFKTASTALFIGGATMVVLGGVLYAVHY